MQRVYRVPDLVNTEAKLRRLPDLQHVSDIGCWCLYIIPVTQIDFTVQDKEVSFVFGFGVIFPALSIQDPIPGMRSNRKTGT